MPDKKESATKIVLIFLSLILAIFLLISSFFIIYANEVIPDNSEKKTEIQKLILYKKVFLWPQIKSFSSYKNKILTTKDENSDFIIRWTIRIFWIFALWFALTLILIPVFPNEQKDILAIKSFKISFILIPIFIILTKIYLFFLNGWFDIYWLFERKNWLSIFDKIIILIFIAFAFFIVWYIYNYKKKKEEEENEIQ